MTRLDLEGIRVDAGQEEREGFSLRLPSLRAVSGDRIALVGASGAGKTTVLELLALLRSMAAARAFRLTHGRQTMDFGALMLEGRQERLAGFRGRYIGYVPQSGGLLPFLSARENVHTTVRAAGWPLTDAIRVRLHDATRLLGLDGHMTKRRGHLSGGERKRVAIVRALAMPRLLLLADEPTAGLDDLAAQAALDTLVRFNDVDRGICVIATHDVDLARHYGFRIVQVRRDGGLGISTVDTCEPEAASADAVDPPLAPAPAPARARDREVRS